MPYERDAGDATLNKTMQHRLRLFFILDCFQMDTDYPDTSMDHHLKTASRTDHTASPDIHNNSTSWYIGCWHENARSG